MYVLGTAGHVDHGKSTLVQTLTGTNPDRLIEEQRRAMTIDLGFAHCTLPNGEIISLVDVPGHERFIKNMLAGVGGIDAVLLVIAADEGIMPQTEEHLHIIDLLDIGHGVVVLTKRDLVDDEWLDLVTEDVHARLATTTLRDAPIVAVSARTGIGLDQLIATLEHTLTATPSRNSTRGTPRLPIDRVFTIGGFGTVVTGTLLDGMLAIGDEIVVAPAGVTGRVRGLQTHGARQDQALPGTRVAVNIAGVDVAQISRGDVVTRPGQHHPTVLLDLLVRVVADAPAPLEHNDAIDLFVGAAEVAARATLLDRDAIAPGSEGWVQLRLDRPVLAARGDRCILRIPSPSQTIGGGRIIDVHPARHRRFRPDVIVRLDTLRRGTPAELLLQTLHGGPLQWQAAQTQAALDAETATAALDALLASGQACWIGGTDAAAGWICSATTWARLGATVADVLASYHRRWPLRSGMPREEFRSRLALVAPRAFDVVVRQLATDGTIAADEALIRAQGWTPQLNAVQQAAADRTLRLFAATPFMPPARAEWEGVGADLLGFLIESGRLVRISADVLFEAAAYAKLVEWIDAALTHHGEVTVAQLRDQFDTSRKYALALLEHLDERKITRRVGDVRVRY